MWFNQKSKNGFEISPWFFVNKSGKITGCSKNIFLNVIIK